MRGLMGPVAIYLVIKLLLLAAASIVGALLHWLAPSIDLGTGLLIGLLATGMTVHFFARLSQWSEIFQLVNTPDEPEYLPPEYSPPPMPIIEPAAPRRGRRRR